MTARGHSTAPCCDRVCCSRLTALRTGTLTAGNYNPSELYCQTHSPAGKLPSFPASTSIAEPRMASRALKQLGEKAFQPLKNGDIWHKPAISAKNFAKLKRQTVAEGREWEFDQVSPRAGYQRQPKGHKHDKLAVLRQEDIQKNLDGMAERIQKYRDSRKLKEASILDQLLLTPKQRRLKQYREAK